MLVLAAWMERMASFWYDDSSLSSLVPSDYHHRLRKKLLWVVLDHPSFRLLSYHTLHICQIHKLACHYVNIEI